MFGFMLFWWVEVLRKLVVRLRKDEERESRRTEVQPENSRRAIRRIDQTPSADCRCRAFCIAVCVFMMRNAKRGPQPVALRSGDFWEKEEV